MHTYTHIYTLIININNNKLFPKKNAWQPIKATTNKRKKSKSKSKSKTSVTILSK